MHTEDAVPCGCIDKFIVAGKGDLNVNTLTWERAEVLPETQGERTLCGSPKPREAPVPRRLGRKDVWRRSQH